MTLQLDGNLILIGAGKMGGALLLGMLERGLDPKSVIVQDPAPPEDIKAALAKFDIAPTPDAQPGGDRVSTIILAVKPQLVAKVLPGVAAKLIGPDTLVISVAAGLTIQNLATHTGPNAALIRAMPNTPASIGHGMTVCYPNKNVSQTQRETCEALLSAVGATAWINDEHDMDAVTALSGSGPAYVFHMAECLTQAGVSEGLDEKLAAQLAVETIYGAGALLKASTQDAPTLRKNVTSPGGTTSKALAVLMKDEHGLKSLMEEAIKAAANRSRELKG